MQVVPDSSLADEHLEEVEYDAVGDYHRQAAHHFAAAAKHHLKAAQADDDGDEASLILHAHMAYRHQLNGIQYAEIAAIESELDADEVHFDVVTE
ncbi:MAG: hypothetical protein D4R79_16685 [Comamonadaceae bacterium]|nr:MAG: hypothetical protein D4R79_16685 [Comamonadaceae bacterium]